MSVFMQMSVLAAQRTDTASVLPVDSLAAAAPADSVAAVLPDTEPDMTMEQMLSRAASMMDVYDFAGALKLYERALESESDSLAIDAVVRKKILADNGVRMMDYAQEPTVIARHRFSKRDFFLYYPAHSGHWAVTPNDLDSSRERISPAVFVKDDADRIFWSAKQDDGNRNLFMTQFKDSVWSIPAPVGEALTSCGNEVWPMLSNDGKKLFFASDGLYGVGGYDLYVSEWDQTSGEWGVPSNLGFPFSSPGNDLLYMETEDEKYSIFASDRNSDRDSIDVYVLAYDAMPVRHRIDDPVKLCGLAQLTPEESISRMDTGSSTATDMEENADIRKYMEKMDEVRALKDSLAQATRELNERRVVFATSDDEDLRAGLTEEILRREQEIPDIQAAATRAMSELQSIELDFLFKGVILDPEKLQKKAEREVVGTTAAYTFSRMEPGRLPKLVFEEPEPLEE